jgi:3-methylcrotonyl-CoA carboxylase alpha subunit
VSVFTEAHYLQHTNFVYRIESMKMETVIRSPQKGVIAKLVHKEGVGKKEIPLESSADFYQDICKAGTVLVLFEEVCHIKI